MQRIRKWKRQFGVFEILSVLQMVAGLTWLGFCGIHMPQGEQSRNLLLAAENGIWDEYTGLLYPVFLRFYLWMLSMGDLGELLGRFLIFLSQGAALFGALWFLLGFSALDEYVSSGKKRCLAVLNILFFPIILQSVVTLSPQCFSFALLCIFMRFLLDTDKGYKYRLFGISCLYFVLSFLSVEYGAMAGILWLLFEIKRCFTAIVSKQKEGGKVGKGLLEGGIFLLVTIVIWLMAGWGLKTEESNRLPGRLETGFMYNVAFDSLEADYYFWPENVKTAISFEELHECSGSRSLFLTEVRNELTAAGFSAGQQRNAAMQIALASVKNRSKDTLILLGKQTVENLFAPFTLLGNLEGMGRSNTAYHLAAFNGENMEIAKIYLYIGLLIFFFRFFMQLFTGGFALYQRKRNDRLRNAFLLMAIVCAIWNAIFQMRYFDYMELLPVFAAGVYCITTRGFLNCK